MKLEKLIIFLAIHIIGAIITMIVHYKNGTFEYATKHGDGIRLAKPTDIIYQDCLVWEFLLLFFIIDFLDEKINSLFTKKFKKVKIE